MRPRVANVHQRLLPVPAEQVGALLDTLATAADGIWPVEQWPRIRFVGGLQLGALGGHGPVRYRVTQHEPGHRVRFTFMAPHGLEGDHWLEVIPVGAGSTLLRHGLVAETHGAMRVAWRLVWGPLHDALLEDALARVQSHVTGEQTTTRWSPWVCLLRRALG